MSLRSIISIGAPLILLAALAWVVIPPFPSPTALMDSSFASLTAQLGQPTGSIRTETVVWQKSRGVVAWLLVVGYDTATIGATALPRYVSRSLVVEWAGVSVPFGYVVRARIMAPNNRFERSRVASSVDQGGSR
jgi:hypothetical protein